MHQIAFFVLWVILFIQQYTVKLRPLFKYCHYPDLAEQVAVSVLKLHGMKNVFDLIRQDSCQL